MSDKELLELAAKAAGIDLIPMETKNVEFQGDDRFHGYLTNTEIRGWWNPLTNDGDALRLAVKLGMLVDVRYGEGESKTICVTYWITPRHGDRIEIKGESYSATRRAIVRAAAEIGRNRA